MQAAAQDIGPLPDHERRDVFPRLRLIVIAVRKRGWNVVDILGGSASIFIEALGHPVEAFGAFENCPKGEGVDVEELDLVDKKDKVARRS